MRRIVVIAAVVLASLVGGVGTAFASSPWGGINCDQTPTPACRLGAGSGGDPGGGGPSGGGRRFPSEHGSSGGHRGSGGSHQPNNPGDTVVGGGSNLAHCSYVRSDFRPPAGAITTAAIRPLNPGRTGHPQRVLIGYTLTRADAASLPSASAGSTPGPSGAWYVWKCTGPGVADALFHPPVWIPNGQRAPGASVAPSPAQLAEIAHSQLRLPAPAIAANPAGEQLVTVPTWLWLVGGWRSMSATASVPGASVKAVATPTSVTWSMGDGGIVTCRGPGSPFPVGGNPNATSPTCGHTYRVSSAGQPNHAFTVTATVHWSIAWSGMGQAGVFPNMTTEAQAAFPVAEAQALNTGPG